MDLAEPSKDSDAILTNSPEKMNIIFDGFQSETIDIVVPAGPQCYCTLPRDFNRPDFQCSVCYKWFHLECIAFNIGKSLPFLTAYHFMCKKCNSNGEEVFSRKQANFTVMCQTALANLMFKHGGRLYFSESTELIPFLETYWEELTTQPRKPNNSWYPNIHKALTSSDVFKTVENAGELFVCLANTDLSKMGPSYDRFRALTSQLRTNISKLGFPPANISSNCNIQGHSFSTNHLSDGQEQTSTITQFNQGSNMEVESCGDAPVWRKRKSPGSGLSAGMGNFGGSVGSTSSAAAMSVDSSTAGGSTILDNVPGIVTRTNTSTTCDPNNNLSGGLVRSTRRTAASVLGGTTALSGTSSSLTDEGRAKLNTLGFPIDHALNKEGYRYILVEPDKHVVGRDQWDECEFTAGKPIPGLFYRVFLSPQVVLSLSDRANHLKLHESQLAVTGDKGYCMVRATHSVHSGTWYFEATITEQPENAATRIGWSQMLGNLQAPCGYDKFSYSWRSHLGTVFHEARGKHYAEEGYKKDDVIGCLIHLPSLQHTALTALENTPDFDNGFSTFKQPRLVSNSTTINETKSSAIAPGAIKFDGVMSNLKSDQTSTHYLPETYKDRPLIRFRNSFYFEEKDEPLKAEKLLTPLPGSSITFYRNGHCLGPAFKNIYSGSYYPAISIYRSATVSVNFGPCFKYPPNDIKDWEPMSARIVSAVVEQTVADLLYLVEQDGYVDRMIQSCTTGS